jgi:hypothetical protein
LARFGKFREMFLYAGFDPAFTALNPSTLFLDIGCTYTYASSFLCHYGRYGEQQRSYHDALDHISSLTNKCKASTGAPGRPNRVYFKELYASPSLRASENASQRCIYLDQRQ